MKKFQFILVFLHYLLHVLICESFSQYILQFQFFQLILVLVLVLVFKISLLPSWLKLFFSVYWARLLIVDECIETVFWHVIL